MTDPETAIPEPRLAEAWNGYIDTLGAPEDQKVTPAELHNLRDAFLPTVRFDWNRGYRNYGPFLDLRHTAGRPSGPRVPSSRIDSRSLGPRPQARQSQSSPRPRERGCAHVRSLSEIIRIKRDFRQTRRNIVLGETSLSHTARTTKLHSDQRQQSIRRCGNGDAHKNTLVR